MNPEQALACTAYIRQHTSFEPLTGIILGTGLGKLADEVEIEKVFDYHELPHFPISTVESHAGKLIFGHLSGKPVVVMQGRFHFYEGYTMQQVTFPVRVMKLLGIEQLFISNISGGLNPAYELGDLVLIEDHINLQNQNPLTGANVDVWGVRFPDMLEPYNYQLLQKGKVICTKAGYNFHEGVYVSVPGPNLETRAEYKYLRTVGADLVGMSTVPEVIAAVHAGLKVFAASIITDLCYEPRLKKAKIEDIIAVANEAEPKLLHLFKEMLG
ncbi:MAG: purine-nucleoside phosphorylase [Flavobacteriaceae bacterium]|nr:purine-nucleoside phosphorylase [Flavobacteriaceae bacterium]